MLSSIFELIRFLASNSLCVFCICNLLIGILLVGSSKSSWEFNEDKTDPIPSIDNKEVYRSIETPKVEETDNKSVCITLVDADEERREDDDDEDEDDYDDDDDDLTRRIEEFIEKVNRGWRDENLETYLLGQ